MNLYGGVCTRCGQVIGSWHTRAQCDAAYDAAYRRASSPQPYTFVTGVREDEVSIFAAKEPEQRHWVVYQKGKGGTNVRAENCRVTEGGALVFWNDGQLVMAFGPGGWTFMEEEDVD